MNANVLFLRFEGPMQSWGDQQSKFVIRRTCNAPTKSGVIGMLCSALGVCRSDAASSWLPTLSALEMGVRIDSPGVRCWDYHTVGARMRMPISEGEGKTKPGAMLTRREYLCDASFLVALKGDSALIEELEKAMKAPKWSLYLGRKCCPPSRPLLEHPAARFQDVLSALKSVPWRPRLRNDQPPKAVICLVEWRPTVEEPEAPSDALICYDVPRTFEPPSHEPRIVILMELPIGIESGVNLGNRPAQNYTPRPPRKRADYGNTAYKKKRKERLDHDHHLCVFCKSPATTVQHITYRRAGGNEDADDLRALCRLCHDAITMIEYGLGMGMDRINPEEPRWREMIIRKRNEIIEFRSLESRRRRLSVQEVE